VKRVIQYALRGSVTLSTLPQRSYVICTVGRSPVARGVVMLRFASALPPSLIACEWDAVVLVDAKVTGRPGMV